MFKIITDLLNDMTLKLNNSNMIKMFKDYKCNPYAY